MFNIKENKRKFLGGSIGVFNAISVFVVSLFPVLVSVLIYKSDKSSNAKLLLIIFSLSSILLFILIFFTTRKQLYVWGRFTDKYIEVFVPFSKKYKIYYNKCNDVGFACYYASAYKPYAGFRYTVIYLSYDIVGKKYKYNINMLKQNKSVVKIKYNEKIYDYLITVLPTKQSRMLKLAKLDWEKDKR